MKITNPETGQAHEMDAEAFAELREAVKQAKANDRGEVVFRAMRIDLGQAERILISDI